MKFLKAKKLYSKHQIKVGECFLQNSIKFQLTRRIITVKRFSSFEMHIPVLGFLSSNDTSLSRHNPARDKLMTKSNEL